ncbi:hypothetical protein ACWGMU_20170, partial [Streptomyces diastaticus]
RGLQGMGMGMVPLGIALLRDVVPKERLSSSIAVRPVRAGRARAGAAFASCGSGCAARTA